MSNGASLAGQAPAFPVVIDNPPGLGAIDYRVGDYTSFRAALMQSLPGEVALAGWRPIEGDLALQLLEWWAYLADILTFYNERFANASYLGTAVLPVASQTGGGGATAPGAGASPGAGAGGGTSATAGAPDPTTAQNIARAVGYRPTPGIAATGQLGVLVNNVTSITILAGFAVQNKPGPGQKPQVFEANAQGTYLPTNAGGAVPIDLHAPTAIDALAPTGSLLLQGAISGVKPNDMVIFAQTPYTSATSVGAVVASASPEPDPRGQLNTRLMLQPFTPPPTVTAQSAAEKDVTTFQVLRSIQSIPVYTYTTYVSGTVVAPNPASLLMPSAPASPQTNPTGLHLASIARAITVGDLVSLEVPDPNGGPGTPTSAVVTQYQETIWYANADDPTKPDVPPAASTTTPPTVAAIPIPHTFLVLSVTPPPGVARVWYAFRLIGAPIDEFVTGPLLASAVGSSRVTPGTPATPETPANYVKPVGTVNTIPGFPIQTTVLLEGVDGIGAVATLSAPIVPPGPPPPTLALSSSDTTTQLTLPLRAIFNVMSVTAGKTVTGEVLGNGDATVAGQSFTLQNAPLTYVAGSDPAFPTSTLQVFVNGVAWTEVASFSAQPAEAWVFVTQEDASQVTTVTFGDGVHGARLPTGTGNVTANYRYGSGPGDPGLGGPAVGTLITVLTPQPGLGSIRNPVAMTGGAAPTTAAQIQASAPAATLSFGSAVSASDLEAIASQAPLVTRARAVYGWSKCARRAMTTLYVAGGADVVSAVQHAIAQASDANAPVAVVLAKEVDLSLALVVVYGPTYAPSAVQAAVVAALTDPAAGPFAPSQIRIGDPLYASALGAACMSVPGVVSVRSLVFSYQDSIIEIPPATSYAPGTGAYFALAASDVTATMEAGNG